MVLAFREMLIGCRESRSQGKTGTSNSLLARRTEGLNSLQEHVSTKALTRKKVMKLFQFLLESRSSLSTSSCGDGSTDVLKGRETNFNPKVPKYVVSVILVKERLSTEGQRDTINSSSLLLLV